MAHKPLRQSQLISFDNAAAGHEGVLSSRSGEIVVKPCKQSEVDFYESMKTHLALAPYVPEYMGTLMLGDTQTAPAPSTLLLPPETAPEGTPAVAIGTEPQPLIENQWTPSYGGKIQTNLAIVLENVASSFKKPNIMDVKLGARLWADDAPPAKRARLDKAAEETTSKSLAYRIAGMKTYHGPALAGETGLNADGYRAFDKNYGRGFTVDTVRQAFEDYFLLPRGTTAVGGVRKVIRRFVDDLHEVAQAITNEESRMFSASLLFVYEGDREALDAAFVGEKEALAALKEKQGIGGDEAANGRSGPDQEIAREDDEDEQEEPMFPAIQRLKLIDFAHAQWTPGQGPDENILQGIRNLAQMLGDLAA